MSDLVARLSPVLHLTRITNAFAVVGNVWFVILWSRAMPAERADAPAEIIERPLWFVLGAGLAFAVGLFGFAMAVNDVFDRRRDRALNPGRPLASGTLSAETAVGVVTATLLAAVTAAAAMGVGAVLLAAGTAAAVIAYTAALRYVPSLGLVLVSLIYGSHMMVPNIYLHFVWPVWLALTHALIVAAWTHHLAGKRPPLSRGALCTAGAGWAFWSAVLLAVGWVRSGSPWPSDVPVLGGLLAAALVPCFVFVAWRKSRRAASAKRGAEKVQRYGSLWLTLYATAWFVGSGHPHEAAIIGVLAALGFLGMTILREAYSLIEHPIGFRR